MTCVNGMLSQPCPTCDGTNKVWRYGEFEGTPYSGYGYHDCPICEEVTDEEDNGND